jgi:hypothetical protein
MISLEELYVEACNVCPERDCKYIPRITCPEHIALREDYGDGSQQAESDAGKPQLSLVPLAMMEPIARVREYGCKKYGDPENWKQVSPERYRDALLRHLYAYMEDPKSVDEESGLKHFDHALCNMAFLAWFEQKGEE